MKSRLVMIGVLLCLSSCADTMHGDPTDPVDVDEAMPPIGGHRANGTTVRAPPAQASAAGHVRQLPRVDPDPDAATEAYHSMPDAAAMQMISSGYDPAQAGDDDDQDQEDGKHFVVPDTQVSYGKPKGSGAN
ncbi:hypothetical protein [Novacetimonas pomaceti]|nr:hypothetical protein [Novacetimonas pomaceti]